VDHTILDVTNTLWNGPTSKVHWKSDGTLVVPENNNNIEDEVHKLPDNYYIKFRPGLFDFLLAIRDMYSISLCTLGTRPHVKYIVQLIEHVCGSNFFHKVKCREDLGTTKEKRLNGWWETRKSVIVDDNRDNVWKEAKEVGLIVANPFLYFLKQQQLQQQQRLLALTGGTTQPPAGAPAASDTTYTAWCKLYILLERIYQAWIEHPTVDVRTLIPNRAAPLIQSIVQPPPQNTIVCSQ